MPRTVLSALYEAASASLTAILRGRCYYHFHFTDEESTSEKSNNLPKVTKLVKWWSADYDQVCLTTCTEASQR